MLLREVIFFYFDEMPSLVYAVVKFSFYNPNTGDICEPTKRKKKRKKGANSMNNFGH